MDWLLPHRFKSIGTILVPVGFIAWLAAQRWMNSFDHLLRVSVLTVSVFAFLFGLYCISFARERFEDEMVQRTRLDSFQFAAIIQIISIFTGFVGMLVFGEPREAGMMLFLIALIFLFWITYIIRFNYIIHVRLRP